MDASEETLRLLAEALSAFARQMAEQNRLREQGLALEERRLEVAEETNRLYLRSVEQQEANGRDYRQRLAESPKQQRRALVVLAVILILALVVLALLPTAHHPN